MEQPWNNTDHKQNCVVCNRVVVYIREFGVNRRGVSAYHEHAKALMRKETEGKILAKKGKNMIKCKGKVSKEAKVMILKKHRVW